MTTPITPLEQRVIDAARQIDSLAEVCDLIDYDPKIGRVPAHWRVKSPLMWAINIATQQPAPQPLTDEQIDEICEQVFQQHQHTCGSLIARAIERAHGIGEQP